jgi:hypothetical protein
MPPVFKTGESRVSPGSGRFDSDTLPPISTSLAKPFQLSGEGAGCREQSTFLGQGKVLFLDIPLYRTSRVEACGNPKLHYPISPLPAVAPGRRRRCAPVSPRRSQPREAMDESTWPRKRNRSQRSRNQGITACATARTATLAPMSAALILAVTEPNGMICERQENASIGCVRAFGPIGGSDNPVPRVRQSLSLPTRS